MPPIDGFNQPHQCLTGPAPTATSTCEFRVWLWNHDYLADNILTTAYRYRVARFWSRTVPFVLLCSSSSQCLEKAQPCSSDITFAGFGRGLIGQNWLKSKTFIPFVCTSKSQPSPSRASKASWRFRFGQGKIFAILLILVSCLQLPSTRCFSFRGGCSRGAGNSPYAGLEDPKATASCVIVMIARRLQSCRSRGLKRGYALMQG